MMSQEDGMFISNLKPKLFVINNHGVYLITFLRKREKRKKREKRDFYRFSNVVKLFFEQNMTGNCITNGI